MYKRCIYFILAGLLCQHCTTGQPSHQQVIAQLDAHIFRYVESIHDQKLRINSNLFPSFIMAEGNTAIPVLPNFREGDRAINGANVWHDQDLYRLMQLYEHDRGSYNYAVFASSTLQFFLKKYRNEITGLYPWGEHSYVDLYTGEVSGKDIHEFYGPMLLFNEFIAVDTAAWIDYALSVWRSQIRDKQTGEFSRHARFSSVGPYKGDEFPRHGSFMIKLWADAYRVSGNPIFLNYIITLTNLYLDRYAQLGYIPYSGKKINEIRPVSNLIMLTSLYYAVQNMPNNATNKLNMLITAVENSTLSFFDSVKDTVKWTSESVDNVTEIKYLIGEGYGTQSYSSLAIIFYELYQNSRDDSYLQRALTFSNLGNIASKKEKYPETYAARIWSNICAYQLTNEVGYLDKAMTTAIETFQLFFKDKLKGLPVARTYLDHYESITGGPTLMLSYYLLQQVLEGKDISLPFSAY